MISSLPWSEHNNDVAILLLCFDVEEAGDFFNPLLPRSEDADQLMSPSCCSVLLWCLIHPLVLS